MFARIDEFTIARLTERPLLSIVVPGADEEVVIGRFIASVHPAWTRLRDPWEAIIVDDGSADRTVSIVREAANTDDAFASSRHLTGGRARRFARFPGGMWPLGADGRRRLSMPWDNLPRFLDVVAGTSTRRRS